MKYIVLLIATIAIAQTVHFKQVLHKGTVLKNVTLTVSNDSKYYEIWYNNTKLNRDSYMIVSCGTSKFCLVKNEAYSKKWMEK